MRFSNKDSYLCFVFVIVLCRRIETRKILKSLHLRCSFNRTIVELKLENQVSVKTLFYY